MIPDPLTRGEWSEEAERAAGDFGYFVERYFGRRQTPWQIHAANEVVRALEAPELVFMVVNAPPGAGKSVSFTHDITLWATVRDRSLRGLIGSSSALLAGKPIARMRRSLERERPIRATSRELTSGSVDAVSTLARDYGRFKPIRDVWTANGFVVAQVGDEAVTEKELSWSSYGVDSEQLGNRYDLVVWDDLVTFRNTSSVTANRQLKDWFDVECESRPEPGGLFCLMGQRIGPGDLYRYCLDKVTPVVLEDGSRRKMYAHITYPAHITDVCVGRHDGTDLVAFDPAIPRREQMTNCLLDPVRLPWEKLESVRFNRTDLFEIMYQQADVDEGSVLVPKLWITGGVDERGVDLPGCLDHDRSLLQVPKGITGTCISVATLDPSVTGFWAAQWWLYYPDAGLDVLMDLSRARMQAPDLLDWSLNQGCHVGLMEEWQQRSEDLGHPIGTWICEANAAHRYLLQYDHVRTWIAKRKVNVVPHSTMRNKSDAERGLWTIRGLYEHGNVRLPWSGEMTRATITPMVQELTHYTATGTGVDTDDTVMAHWFLHWGRQNMGWEQVILPQRWTPTWVNRDPAYAGRGLPA